MNGYISYLYDFNSRETKKHLFLDCKHPEVATPINGLVKGEIQGTEIKLDKKSFCEKFNGYVKRPEYVEYCHKNLMIPVTRSPFDASYIAAIFDLSGSFLFNERNGITYCVYKCRKKGVTKLLFDYFEKKPTSEFIIQGQELLYAITNIKEYSLYRKEELEELSDCLMDTKNPHAFQEYLTRKK